MRVVSEREKRQIAEDVIRAASHAGKEGAQEVLAECIGDTFRGLWEHYKGGLYIIYSESAHEETGEILLHYYSLKNRTRWTRTLANWIQNVRIGEKDPGPRFKWIRSVTQEELVQAALDNGD